MTQLAPVYHSPDGWQKLDECLEAFSASGLFVLAGPHTSIQCLPLLKKACRRVENSHLIVLPGGEEAKHIGSVEKVWSQLLAAGATRHSVLICLGGGVVTDIGGFVAATFKRGMNAIHIPTTLLGMVDAAIGGKSGINFGGAKNQIGAIMEPMGVYFFPEFLHSLSERQVLSGFAEMLKHALLDSEDHLEGLLKWGWKGVALSGERILYSAAVKMKIVQRDPYETGLRKALNFGHTVGHAIEAWSQQAGRNALLHGEAVALGMIAETWLSVAYCGFPAKAQTILTQYIKANYPSVSFSPDDLDEIIRLMSFDKKNRTADAINFALLSGCGQILTDKEPGLPLIRECLKACFLDA